MDYINEIFKRANLQSIREFLLHDASGTIENKSYTARINTAEKLMIENLKNYTSQQEQEKLIDSVYDYASVNQNVYMELGLQCGAILAVQLLSGHTPV